ncbi:MAG: DUF1501 domain-containing protein [Gemmataceae bacterium]
MHAGCASFRQQMDRRQFLQIGGAGLFGLTWTDLFRARASAAAPRARAKQVIFVFLQGGPPHQDTFDLKPDQPDDVRSPFKPIKTKLPGLDICEHLPRLAGLAHRYSVIRSINSLGYPEAGGHHAGLSWKTGNRRGRMGTTKFPMFGSVLAKVRSTPFDLPAFVELGDINQNAVGLKENYLGPAFNPLSLSLDEDPKRNRDAQADLLRLQLTVPEFEQNAELLRALEQQLRQQEQSDELLEGIDQFQRKAIDLLRSTRLREALDLDKEPAKNQERYQAKLIGYGKKNYTRRMLAARRLIEAGVPFVYVDLPYWDWHGGVKASENAGMKTLAAFDNSLSSLLEDLEARGLLATTMVVVLGEMGRTPKMNKNGPAARDHWAAAQFVLVAGGGFKPGQVVGATDAQAAHVKDNEYKIASLGKTIYHLLGLDPDHELYTTDNRPLKLIIDDAPLIKEVL